MVEVSTRHQRGEPIESILADVPDHLRLAIEDNFRAQLTGGEVADKLCLHFKVGSAVVANTTMFTMMVYRDPTERELVAALMITPDRVMKFAKIVGDAAKAFFKSAETH